MLRRVAFSTVSWPVLALSATLLYPGVPCCAQHSQNDHEPRTNPQTPLEAELLAPLDASKLVRGASVLAKARLDWNGPTCLLRAGSVVSGRIVDLEQRSRQNKGSSLTILFDHANCDGHLTPTGFTLVALIIKPYLDEGRPLLDSGFVKRLRRASDPRILKNTGPQSRLDVGGAMALRAAESSANNAPSLVTAGQVIGLYKVNLSVGTGPEGSSVLTATKGNIRLEHATHFILMPRVAVAADEASAVTAKAEPSSLPMPPASVEAPHITTPEPPAPPETDETEICTAPCSVVPSTVGHELPRASATLSAAHFGYAPHDNRDYETFDYQSSLIYLDSENLLFTFDPHTLRQRYASGIHTESMRTVRAILIDPKTLAVKRVREWQVQGEGQYIWPAGAGKVLVHLGHQLRLLGPELEVIRSVAISGLLAFVSVSPSGDRIAAGVLHERYNQEMHDLLVKVLHDEPEEDIDIQLFDHNFNVILTARQSSSLPPPILSDDGEIRVTFTGKNHWRISEYLWDHTEHTVATTISGCRPGVSAPLTNSLFLVGCSTSRDKNWYRMLRLDGHPILQGHSSFVEIEQASTSSNQSEFAIRVVRARIHKIRGSPFRKEDLHEQKFSIYRAADGKRLFLTTTPGVSLVEQSFALSPSGRQLAVLSNATISFYSIETPVE
jgi:hypothetical protein